MSEDKEDKLKLLTEFEEKQRKGTQKIDSIWKLIKSIHSSPILREWVTIESIPFCPFVVRDTNKRETIVHLLLAVPGDIKGDIKGSEIMLFCLLGDI